MTAAGRRDAASDRACAPPLLIHELTLGLEPEDGVIWVYGVDDGDGTLAFTDEGVEEVELLLAEYNGIRPSKP